MDAYIKMFKLKYGTLLFEIALVFIFAACSEERVDLVNSYKELYVGDHSVDSENVDYSNIKSIVESAPENSRIHMSEGIYVVDNPVIIKKKGVRIVGRGSAHTIIYPRNGGKEVFRFEADNQGIEGVTVNAKSKDNSGRATFAVLFKQGLENCVISKTIILNTGASAIIGASINNCSIQENVIANSGDDAIQLRGNEITVSNNLIYKYYDEAIDIGNGSNMIVSDNYVCSGRIGIVVDGTDNIIITGNTSVDNSMQGIAMGTNSGGIVFGNKVINSGEYAFSLHNPSLVNMNIVEGENRLGFNIHGMEGGIIHQNDVVAADHGFKLNKSKDNLIYHNKYAGQDERIIIFDERSRNNRLYANVRFPAHDDNGDVNSKKCEGLNTFYSPVMERTLKQDNMSVEAFMTELSRGIVPPYNKEIEITGQTERDLKIAKNVAKFLMLNNPGVISIDVKEAKSMKSEITKGLYEILKGSHQLGIGIVRWPYFLFRWSTSSKFPLWRLSVEGREVAVIKRKMTGAKVKIKLVNDK